MAPRQVSPTVLLLLFCAAGCLTLGSILMLGPLLVALAHEFHTSVAVAGQLVAATAITWGMTALLAGPVSDTYGRRLMLLTGVLLMAVGLLGSALAWNYVSLFAFRLLTGVGGALVPPNLIATLPDILPPARRGQAMGWLVSATGGVAAGGVPLVAFLLEVGGWRLPFYVMGVGALGIWILFWTWLPQSSRQPGQSLAFFSRYRAVGAHATFWYVLAVNALQQMVFVGMLSYLATHLMQTYHLPAGATALPLALAGSGVIVGGFLGGRVAGHPHRVAWFALSCVGGGLLAALVFTARVSPWVSVALAGGAAGLVRISSTVTPMVLMEWAGESRTTATGLFAVSNQMGVFGGPSVGGLALALGGFSMVGWLWLGVGVVAAAVVRLKVQDSAAFLAQMALRQGKMAPE